MNVDSYLEMFTLLFGWSFYDNLWYILEGTGILLLPFIGMVLDVIIDYKNGTEVGDSEELAFKGLFWQMISACFVILFCGVPYMNFSATEVVFIPSAMDASAANSSYTIASIDATYGTNDSFSNYPIDVKVPAFWMLVHNFSLGITHTLMESASPAVDLREYIEQLKELKIADPNLRAEVADFTEDCFIPAKSKYLRDKANQTGNHTVIIQDIINDLGESDPFWIGSYIYQTIPGYYDSLRSKIAVKGFPYDPSRDVEYKITDSDTPVFGRPYCDKWWANSGGLRAKIYNGISDDLSWIEATSAYINSTFSLATRQDLIIKVGLSQTPSGYTPRGYDLSYANTNSVESYGQNLMSKYTKQAIAYAGAYIERRKTAVDVTMLLNSAPMLQALLLMLITIFLPFVLFLSKYSIKAVLIIAWGFFTLRFFTFCWFCAWWLDQNLLAALFPPNIALEAANLPHEGYNSPTNEALMYMLNYLYIVIPIVFTVVSGWAGYNIIRGIGPNTMMGGMATAGGRAAGKVISAAGGIKGALKK